MLDDNYYVEARLEGIRPPVRRLLLVPGRYKLHQMHQVLQIVFGWRDYHLHEFHIGKRRFVSAEHEEDLHVYSLHDFESESVLLDIDLGEDPSAAIDERDVRLRDVLAPSLRFVYSYDFGDDWRVQLFVSQVVQSSEGTYAVCLEGDGSNPPEDCGGIPGYYDLLRHGKGLRPFDLEAANRALTRRFHQHPKNPVQFEPQPYNDGSDTPPRLENYRLGSCNLHEQMKLALTEGPMTLEQLAHRLESVGVRPRHGVESLRKAWKRQPPIREKVDGRLELDVDNAEYWSVEFLKQEKLLKPLLNVEPPPKPTVDPDTPIGWSELEACGDRKWPWAWSLRRRFMLCLDAHGTPVSQTQLVADLHRLGQSKPSEFTSSSLRGPAFMHHEDGRVSIYPDHSDVAQVRRLFRSWWQKVDSDVRQAQERAHETARRMEQRQKETEEEHQKFAAGRKALLRLHFRGNQVAGSLWFFPQGKSLCFRPGNHAALRDTLESLDLAVGIDPRGDYERLECEMGNRRYLDVSPPFKYPRRTVAEAITYCMDGSPALANPAQYERLWQQGDVDALMTRLERDAETIYKWYRLGVMREAVPCYEDDDLHLYRVDWNLGHEPTLPQTLERAIKERCPVTLLLPPGLAPPGVPIRVGEPVRRCFTPQRVEYDRISGRTYHGCWEDGRPGEIDFDTILDFIPFAGL